MRRLLLAAATVAAMTAPAFADTLSEMIAKGVYYSVQGTDMEISFTADGKFTGMDGQLQGTWKIKDDKLCTVSNLAQTEDCVAYPKDKKSGDEFQLETASGPAKVKIK